MATAATSNQLERRGMESSWLKMVQRRFEDVGIQSSGMKRPAGLGAGEPDFRGTEEQWVDLVEVPSVPLEDLVKRSAVVSGGRGRNLLRQFLKLAVSCLDCVTRLATIQDAVVGPPDGLEIVL